MIMVHPGLEALGVAIKLIDSTFDVIGTRDDPIFFFPTAGAAAMTLPQERAEQGSTMPRPTTA